MIWIACGNDLRYIIKNIFNILLGGPLYLAFSMAAGVSEGIS